MQIKELSILEDTSDDNGDGDAFMHESTVSGTSTTTNSNDNSDERNDYNNQIPDICQYVNVQEPMMKAMKYLRITQVGNNRENHQMPSCSCCDMFIIDTEPA